jgi:hypothetical protein
MVRFQASSFFAATAREPGGELADQPGQCGQVMC